MQRGRFYYLFPFELIRPGENIIIYGYGHVGQWFFAQMRDTHYANVIAVVDRAYDRYESNEVPVVSPEKIPSFKFDKIVIAIEDNIVANRLIQTIISKYDVPLEKIVLGLNYKKIVPEIKLPIPVLDSEITLAYHLPGVIPIAAWVGGGIGDNIIFKRKIDEIMKLDNRLTIDLYTMPNFANCVKSIYGADAYNGRLNKIFDFGDKFYEAEKKKYAFTLYRAIDITLDWVDEGWVQDSSQILNICLQKLEQRVAEKNYWQTTDMAVHYALCAKRGFNAYTSANQSGALQVSDYHTNIPMCPEFKGKYTALNLKKYMTITAGFDKVSEIDSQQTKCWSIEKFSQLVQLIRQSYPEVEVLQVDGASVDKVQGCNRYFLGQNLELVKYILRGSLLHISIEGGLVHLASQLDTKCLVLFGPTPIEYYGYPCNINLQVGKCQNCLWLEPNNHYKCCRNLKRPECMEAITPGLVYAEVKKYLNDTIEVETAIK